MAHVRELQGGVFVKPNGILDWSSATKEMELRRGDMVKTDPASGVDIEFLDGLSVRLGAGSLTTIEGAAEQEQRRADLKVVTGGVSYKKQAATTTGLKTEGLEWRGGDAGKASGTLAVDQNGGTELQQFEGTGVVKTKKGESVTVGPRQGVKLAKSGEVARIDLPDAPKLVTPQHESTLAYAQPGATTTVLTWQPVDGAESYHVMLDVDAWFAKPLVDKPAVKATSISVPGLVEGKYYWRVAALGKQGAQGAFANFARFSITRSEVAPPTISIEPLTVRGAIVHLRGTTDRGAIVTANGQAIDVQRDGSFDEYLTLENGPQKVVIKAKGKDGQVRTEERTVTVGGS
jgi:hypothetical protein